MRSFPRLGVAALTAALASATALSGAAVANAEASGPVLDSPSVLTVSEIVGDEIRGTYDNRSGRTLAGCVLAVVPLESLDDLIGLFQGLQGDGVDPETVGDLDINGGFLGTGLPSGETTPFAVALRGAWVPTGQTAVASVCVDGAGDYTEIEFALVGSDGFGSLSGLLGSLGDGLPFEL